MVKVLGGCGGRTTSKELTGFRGHEMLERLPVCSPLRTHTPTDTCTLSHLLATHRGRSAKAACILL